MTGRTTSSGAARRFHRLRRRAGNDRLLIGMMAVGAGVLAAFGAVGLRLSIAAIQRVAFGDTSGSLHTLAAGLPGWRLLLAPGLGGLIVGAMVHALLPGRRPRSVPHVIAAEARNGGRIPLGAGLAAAAITSISLGCGGSAGREGPTVHLGATLLGWTAQRLRLPRVLTRTLFACAVAAAVAAAFDAPLAGAFFALEVVPGPASLSSLTPVLIAVVAGAAVSRAVYGHFPAFIMPHAHLASLTELPSFALLGIVCGLVAAGFMSAIMGLESAVARLALPRWLSPALGGLLVGLLALARPEVLGVGYGTVNDVLEGRIGPGLLAILLAAKAAAAVLTLSSGFGGGVFSPSLMLGALTGALGGAAAGAMMPGAVSQPAVYALVGMGAVAAPVLGAPASTILIVYEMTGDFIVTLAMVTGVVAAMAVVHRLVGRSYFVWQLERQGLAPPPRPPLGHRG